MSKVKTNWPSWVKLPPDCIRESNKALQTNTWGFRIYRATYSDQVRWDKFITLLKDDAREFLVGEPSDIEIFGGLTHGFVEEEDPNKNQDLLEGLTWDVVEEESKLDGKNWEEARDVHDTWVSSELENETAEGKDKITEADAWEFFIFADEESVNSVVDADANNRRGQRGTYFITVVQSGLVCKSEMGFSDDEDEGDKEDTIEEPDPIPGKAYWQRFRGLLLVDVYASVLNDL